MPRRLSGIIHMLYEALNIFIEATVPEHEIPQVPTTEISQEVHIMAMAFTEYFQAQRQAYDKVDLLHKNISRLGPNNSLIHTFSSAACMDFLSIVIIPLPVNG